MGVALWWVLRAYRKAGGGGVSPRPALIAAGVAGLAALGLYALLGRPDLPDAPYAERLAALKDKQADPAQMTAEELLAVLGAQSQKAPADPRPHVFTGQILLDTGNPSQAANAFEAALRRDPENGAAMLGLGRALVQSQEGAVSPQALALFNGAAQLLPNDPAPVLYLALAATQQKRWADARQLWPEVEKRLAPDDPRHAMVAAMIAEAKNPPKADTPKTD